MFSKVSIKSFVYDLIDVFMFPNQEIQEIYQQDQVNKCYLYQKLTDVVSTSMFFAFICDLNSCVSENKLLNVTFDVMLKSKVFDRLDLLAEFYEQFNCRNEDLRKRVDPFEIESIDKPNVITIELNPKKYYDHFIDHYDNKKHKGLKKSTPGMDLDSYSTRLYDLTKYSNEFLNKPNKVIQSKVKNLYKVKKVIQSKK